ncbi:hypothetical protein PIIN_01858 [Serendipita indica DSM 11827]|uniref:Uncharacterized protein n=1 Tax=Serendipita indica (strain DSM 11827) TaxID=1109443 RepID=G4T9I4_SERID|nr:hypothetical protein PIIN_01858 [Serendipita indica DSM 11827]
MNDHFTDDLAPAANLLGSNSLWSPTIMEELRRRPKRGLPSIELIIMTKLEDSGSWAKHFASELAEELAQCILYEPRRSSRWTFQARTMRSRSTSLTMVLPVYPLRRPEHTQSTRSSHLEFMNAPAGGVTLPSSHCRESCCVTLFTSDDRLERLGQGIQCFYGFEDNYRRPRTRHSQYSTICLRESLPHFYDFVQKGGLLGFVASPGQRQFVAGFIQRRIGWHSRLVIAMIRFASDTRIRPRCTVGKRRRFKGTQYSTRGSRGPRKFLILHLWGPLQDSPRICPANGWLHASIPTRSSLGNLRPL